MGLKDFFFSSKKGDVTLAPPAKSKISPIPGGGNLPTSRQSIPSDFVETITNFGDQFRIITPKTFTELIPVIRRLVALNPDLGQAVHNIVSLGNTGHKIFFDRKVGYNQVDQMRNHLINKKKEWASGQATMDGLVNRFFSQLLIGGALSVEWVPNVDLTGIESVIMVNPEEIRFVLDRRSTHYLPYQMPKNTYGTTVDVTTGLKKLNPNTYKYFALNGDGEVPYGTPPYLTTLEPLSRQRRMLYNLDHVIDQLGIFGFLAVLMTKPDQQDDENDTDYQKRLVSYLEALKGSISQGFKDGIIAGFKDDTEFDFNSVGRDFEKVASVFQENELQVASGAKQDANLWGRGYSTSETQITVVFTKLLSELRNMQIIVKTMLEFGYALELRLAGFEFEFLTVQFNPSTIQDDLKIQQGKEIKIRNLKELYIMGTIDEQQFADEMGYEAPAENKPRVPIEMLAGGKSPTDEAADKTKREKGKDASDKKVRDKNKPQGSKK